MSRLLVFMMCQRERGTIVSIRAKTEGNFQARGLGNFVKAVLSSGFGVLVSYEGGCEMDQMYTRCVLELGV